MEDKKINKQKEKKLEHIEEDMEFSTPEAKIKKIKEKLNSCQKEKNEYLEGWQRERANFLNYKKGEELRIQERIDSVKKHIFTELLPIIDNFNRAINMFSEKEFSQDKWLDGIKQIKREFEKFLNDFGVKEIVAKIGDEFNPEYHEAVEVVEGEEGKIVEILQNGYILNKKILRPTRVKVGKIINN